MPAKIDRVVSVANEFAKIHARLTKLESFPPNGMVKLTDDFGTSGSLPYTSSGAIIAALNTTPITLHRPIPLFVTSSISYGTPVVGTATIAMYIGWIVNGVDNGGLSLVTVNYKPVAGANGDATRTVVIDGTDWNDVMAPGNGNGTWPVTFHFYWSYGMVGGASTTLQIAEAETIVFQTGG